MEVRIATRHTDTTSLRRKFETRNVNQHQLSGPSNSWKTLSRILDLNLGRVSTIFWEDVFKLWNISFWVTSNFRERPSSSIEQTIKSRPKRIGKKYKKSTCTLYAENLQTAYESPACSFYSIQNDEERLSVPKQRFLSRLEDWAKVSGSFEWRLKEFSSHSKRGFRV